MEQIAYTSNCRYGFYWFSVILVAFFCSILTAHTGHGAEKSKAEKIDASVNEALQRFYEQVEDGREVTKRAWGCWYFPMSAKAH